MMKITTQRVAGAALLLPLLLCLSPIAAAQEKNRPARQERQNEPGAAERVETAVAKAGHDNKRVLILWTKTADSGGTLNQLLKSDRAINKLLRYEYVREHIAVDGHGVRKTAKRLAIDLSVGLPAITILDGAGKKLEHVLVASWKTGDTLDPKLINASLTKHKAAPLKAEEVYAAGLAQAAKSGKNLLVHLGAPW